ncbi:hypothetical protein UT300019_32620 [Clostridium sp. CTA-19]
MKLPLQAKPVSRNSFYTTPMDNSVSPNGFLCDMTCTLLPGDAQRICKEACAAGKTLCPTICSALPMPFNMMCSQACDLI